MFSFEQDLAARDALVVKVFTLLSERKYADVELLSGGVRLSNEMMKRAVSEYGRTLVTPPSEATQLFSYVACVGSEEMRWSVWAPFYTHEEGRSNLGLELTLIGATSNEYRVELDNIRVS